MEPPPYNDKDVPVPQVAYSRSYPNTVPPPEIIHVNHEEKPKSTFMGHLGCGLMSFLSGCLCLPCWVYYCVTHD